jgi:sugar transferase (PEP-CTERM/EpsH1 system associated)
MNILFVTPYVPSRIRVRPFHIISELSKRHDVHVVALRDVDKSRIPGGEDLIVSSRSIRVVPHSDLRGFLQSLAAVPTRSPMCTAYCRSRRMRKIIDDMVSERKFDVVHVEHLRAAHFAPLGRGLPVVLDSVDCLTRLFSQMTRSRSGLAGRLVAAEEAWKLRRCEPRILKCFDRVLVTSESEREALLGLDQALKIEIVPNGVDTEYFAPQGAHRKPARLVYSGKMSYLPNVEAVLWFADNVLPALRREFPDLEFVIVGSGPPPQVIKLSAVPGISVTGYVEDIRPYLDASAIAVAPVRTSVGVQNKILEAMAMALPVVTSTAARASIGECAGVLAADDAEDFVSVVSQLVKEPARAVQLGRLGREEVVGRFSWHQSGLQLEAIYEEVLRDFRGSRHSRSSVSLEDRT